MWRHATVEFINIYSFSQAKHYLDGNQLTNGWRFVVTTILCIFDSWTVSRRFHYRLAIFHDDSHKLRPQFSSYPLNQPDEMIATWFSAGLRFRGTHYLLFICFEPTNSAVRCCWVDRRSDFIMLTWAWWCCNCLPPDLINDADLFLSSCSAVLASYPFTATFACFQH